MSLRPDPAQQPAAAPGSPGSAAPGSAAPPAIPLHEVGMANKNAQLRGLGLGIGTGILAGIVARKSLRLSANAAMLSAFVSGTTIAFYGSRQFMLANMRGLEEQLGALSGSGGSAAGAARRGGAPSPDALARERESTALDLRSADEIRFEAGTGGLHELVDRAATTRGDH